MIVIFSENKKERSLKTSFLMYKLSSDFTCQALQKSCFFLLSGTNKFIKQPKQKQDHFRLANKPLCTKPYKLKSKKLEKPPPSVKLISYVSLLHRVKSLVLHLVRGLCTFTVTE